ncbi:MAG: hypothetical protein V3T35_04095 [Spirochaetia bacterium]
MNLHNGIGDAAIQDVVKDHPKIGEILDEYEIGCVGCSVGICLVKDVVSIHFLGDEIEAVIEKQINEYLEKQ